jgi:hypothetical protein
VVNGFAFIYAGATPFGTDPVNFKLTDTSGNWSFSTYTSADSEQLAVNCGAAPVSGTYPITVWAADSTGQIGDTTSPCYPADSMTVNVVCP